MFRLPAACAGTAFLTLSLFASAASAAELADRAFAVLKERCSRCHGGAAKQAGLDVLSRENLIEERGVGPKFRFITPGDPAKSQLIDALDGGADSYMPQSGSPEAKAMTTAEKALLKEWVAAGAPFPKRPERPFLSEQAMLVAMVKHLQAASVDAKFLRFATFTHLFNHPDVTELDLRIARAALAKTLNSLSLREDLHLPQPVAGTNDSVFVFDVRRLGWEKPDRWSKILKRYPYGLSYSRNANNELRDAANLAAELTESDLPYVRADWLIVTALHPELYHTLLEIPTKLSELEAKLNLNLQRNFLDGTLQRSGYAKSGVSKQNRLLERHTSSDTAYFWISYDFLPRRQKGDLVRFPLGPKFDGNPFKDQAFEHDGGEIIWSLPNGLQAYMLVNAKGDRINEGPVEVVFDRQAVLGTPSILNGVSCMVCHRHGMISEFRDEIRGAEALGGDPAAKVRQLHPTHEVMQNLTRLDEKRYLVALEKVIGPFLRVGEDQKRAITEFPEPIAKVAEMYSRDLTPREIALELGFEKVETLRAMVQANRPLLRFGLGTIVQNPPGTLKRDKWETKEGTSLMQDVAAELRIATPLLQ